MQALTRRRITAAVTFALAAHCVPLFTVVLWGNAGQVSEIGIAELFLIPVGFIANPVAWVAAAWGALLGHTLVNDREQSASSVLHAISLGFVITYLSSMTLAALSGLSLLASGEIGTFVGSVILSGLALALVTLGGTFLSGCLFALVLMWGSRWCTQRRTRTL